MSSDPSNELFSSLVSDIKNYDGRDPLRPWLQGIKKMRECLLSHILREKLPRFLQKCVQTFQSDRRYRNDSRYIGVWIQLMDFVDDPKALLRMMERNQIGTKRAAFYMAYAIFYEKRKKIEEAEKMYHLGVENLAEPAAELQKAYEEFLQRLELYKKRKSKLQEIRTKTTSKTVQRQSQLVETKGTDSRHQENPQSLKMKGLASEQCYTNSTDYMDLSRGKYVEDHLSSTHNASITAKKPQLVNSSWVTNTSFATSAESISKEYDHIETKRQNSFGSDDTVVVNFVGSAIVGKSEVEDACHHGLVDPTINMKEAMNAISNMFREPIEIDSKVKRKSQQRQREVNKVSNGFEVFVDEGSEEQEVFSSQKMGNGGHNAPTDAGNISMPKKQMQSENPEPFVGFKILADDDDSDECDDQDDFPMKLPIKESKLPASVNQKTDALPGSCSSADVKQREDTIIRRFMGSTISDESAVENACHHGLVDPTINLKQAMDDINSMFGRPINFVRPRRQKKENDLPHQNQTTTQGFSILADDDMEEQPKKQSLRGPSRLVDVKDHLFEPTIFTKEAMDEINSMFGKPLDF